MTVSAILRCGKNLPSNFASRRLIHSSVVRGDMMDWFRKNKKDSIKPVEDTKDIMRKIEEDGGAAVSAASQSESTKGKVMKLNADNFIGEEIGYVDNRARKEAIANVRFNTWLTSHKVKDELEINEILISAYNESVSDVSNAPVSEISDAVLKKDFDDLAFKFKFTKLLQSKTGYLIPDYLLTTMKTPLEFKDYFTQEILSGKQQRFKESEPNAIHLTNDTFKSKNIRVLEDVPGRFQKKTKNKVLSELYLLNSQLTNEKIKINTD
ncbi:hypothetical protein TPHA_0G03400 [Tetrapisispora phaffii CBS 4417]|uniref:Large ribosomal subunit protein mL50 n=1 Tax=Tetrapisispora phaffii (strain ATCC 24235 / CBS 4417 / NBRC 1672 / NRRL Y-8282 / UCD 70-5) TaxID=1071381 RepID=G8BWA2_TETPH|nr:hypothetical protein TPHA_0G03400 [Tetrapisispora phaffii CBS 4417]CCE64180.1 hypothetical protein TPHA_0G03400 [Tetrapisispora phaffii CBS 4417]